MTELVKRDFLPAILLCSLGESPGDVIRVVAASVFPGKDVSVFILVILLEELTILLLYTLNLLLSL